MVGVNARLSLLLSFALLGACGGPDVDPSDTPTTASAPEQPAQEPAPPVPTTPASATAASPAPAPDPTTAVPTAPAPTAAQQPAFAPTPATVVRETELKTQPSLDARTLATLPVRTAVTIIDRRDGWFEVVREETRGWVRLLHVSSQPPGTHGPIPPELERAAHIATGRAGGGNIVVTTGTRGLTVEELRQAGSNFEELRRMETLGADPARAEDYAREHCLKRRSVPYPSETQGGAR
jgi:hypothetical protein